MGRTPTGEDGAEADSQRQSLARAWLKVGDDPNLRVLGGSEIERGESAWASAWLGLPIGLHEVGALGLRNGREERSEDWAG